MYFTIPGFESLTAQQMFDMAANHIATTRKASVDSNATCIYGGSGCNAAPFLTEEGKKMGDSYSGGGWLLMVAEGHVPQHNAMFVSELQRAHDNSSHVESHQFVVSYVDKMVKLADKYDLNINALAPLQEQ